MKSCMILVVFMIHKSVVFCARQNKNISDAIFAGYDSGLRPLCDGITRINTTLGIALRQVIEMDEPNQIIRLNIWVRLKWDDCLLTWNPDDYGGVDNIIAPYERLWIPDLSLFDGVSGEFEGLNEYRPRIYSDGTVYYNFPTIMEALCSVNVKNFPFDKQICSLVFGSWSYHGFELDFYPREDFGDLSSMRKNVEWDVPKITVEKHVKFYGCCTEPYPDIAFYIHLTRKPSYYITNIILPSLIITVLIVLGFILPVSSGEKVSLEITVMLAISVFQLLVADKLPPSADSTPLIAIFFNLILGLSAASTVIQVVVINVFYQEDKDVPKWMMNSIIKPICFITFVKLPLHQNRSCCFKQNHVEDLTTKHHVEPYSASLWKCFSNAIDRLGLLLFSLTLTIGCTVIFIDIKSDNS